VQVLDAATFEKHFLDEYLMLPLNENKPQVLQKYLQQVKPMWHLLYEYTSESAILIFEKGID
jgi:hypothetical protein